MTDGRFDSSFNMRPGGWDSRRHWTKTHAPFATDPEHIRDHMERESCPFHDLRADGCFQPEHHDHGPDFGTKRPEDLMRRKDGNPMTTGAGVRQHRGRGMGGLPIPEDIEPARAAAPPPAAGLPARRTRPELYRLSYEALIDTVLEWQSAVCPEPG